MREYLTIIIPQARMGSESIGHEAERRTPNAERDIYSEAMRGRGIIIIVLVKSN